MKDGKDQKFANVYEFLYWPIKNQQEDKQINIFNMKTLFKKSLILVQGVSL